MSRHRSSARPPLRRPAAPPRRTLVRRLLLAALPVLLLASCFQAPPATPRERVAPAAAASVFVNELHYDNAGTDTGEAVEVAGPAGTDLSGWSLVLYNGRDGRVYDTVALSGVLPDQQAGHGTTAVTFPTDGLQNGKPDGLALVDAAGAVVEFLSYEGAFTAADGPAAGLDSVDIGVKETNGTPAGTSLQRIGEGSLAADFGWTAGAAASFGAPNAGQTFVGAAPPPAGDPFLNELHYDNTGTDTGEAIEIAGPAGLDLAGWTVAFYNGNGGGVYGTLALSGVLDDEGAGHGALDFPWSGIQNGAPDGLALVAPDGRVVEFLSYEGTLTATSGPAAGLTSVDMGVSETSGTPVGHSLQRTGTGTVASDFAWAPPAAASFGSLNAGQSLGGGGGGGGGGGACSGAYTPAYEVQGSGAASPLVGATVTVEGVVVGDFQGAAGLTGFFLQDPVGDGNAATSDGLFVYDAGSAVDVAEGERVRVTGQVKEYGGLTELASVTEVLVCGPAALPAPAALTLPLAAADALEPLEGMRVRADQTLTVTEVYNLARYGQATLASGGRLVQPTQTTDPAQAGSVAAANDLDRLLLDDGVAAQNPDPVAHPAPGLSAAHTLRVGAEVTGLVGVVDESGGSYRLQPTETPAFVDANPRPAAPAAVGGTLRVASFNVLNYFVTLDGNGAICGPSGSLGCRGADSAQELQRQRDKLVAALVGLDADVVGIVEVENDDGAALRDLVDATNAALGAAVYAPLETGPIGTDAIRVGLMYRPAAVRPLGAHAVLDASVDPDFDSTKNRPALAQSFEELAGGGRVTVIVNHLKSKGSSCGAGDDDPLQGNCNGTRTRAAEALGRWAGADPTGQGVAEVLVIGDLNAYPKEDPVQALVAAGLADQIARFVGAGAYSYVFDGESGVLDHALASAALAPYVTGVTEWHINADEPRALDYNTEYKSAGQVASFYAPDAYRASDHDPVLVGLALPPAP